MDAHEDISPFIQAPRLLRRLATTSKPERSTPARIPDLIDLYLQQRKLKAQEDAPPVVYGLINLLVGRTS